jgi:protein-tyrosine phosphatase
MDMTWITERIACGGGIWHDDKMAELAAMGVTHIVNMQVEFDDRPLARGRGVEVFWNAMEDDFQPKSAEALRRGADFAVRALQNPGTKVYVHCAAGVHRAPMQTLAIMRAMGWELEEAMQMIQRLRPVVDWPDVYVRSVEEAFAVQ